jgi:hypothetical protein
MKILLCLLLSLSLIGCSTIKPIAESPETFAVCKTVDIATTAAIISGGGHELNPIAKGLIGHSYIPLIAVSIGIYFLLKELNEPKLNVAANSVTCGVAAHNLVILL